MFYVKGRGEKINLDYENVFTRCPICGKEFPVDIAELLSGGDVDLYGTSIYCPECAERDGNRMMGRV
ncbi:hypothetical protein [uncultured Dysosmobacter sp.]|uniref:hypothetical protein n=1 Tax=uncultured Dysosmobacter sp. TaxID=2591384 RepID=UPI0026339D0F|nr:hypothetical protein [uncultured Dysosmobacter sp.]